MGKQKVTFEQALESLEQIVASIESGEIGLEESIVKYAEGIKLIKHCRGVLDAAEKKIQLLTAEDEETLTAAGELEDIEE
ncbi:MAG: exodeoxyribonuclease VII small subunit [Planctomycetes bacterium]|nr:exodeoxyribonuclease VII small subunit [Planctomycetota bacterium]